MKNMSSKLIALVLCLTLVLSVGSIAAAEGERTGAGHELCAAAIGVAGALRIPAEHGRSRLDVDLDHGPCVYKRLSGCGAGKDYVAVTPEGDIYPCHQFVGNEAFKMGDVNNGITNGEIKKIFDAGNLLEKEDCQSCWAKYFCGGGSCGVCVRFLIDNNNNHYNI